MKKIAILLICLFVDYRLISQEVNGIYFVDIPLNMAITKAKDNKTGQNMIFMYCYTKYCGSCKYVATNFFPNENVGKFCNNNFVNIKIDTGEEDKNGIIKKYNISAYPTFLILDSNGCEINRFYGSSKDAESFLERIKFAMNPVNSPTTKKTTYDNKKNIENAISYLESLQLSHLNSEVTTFIENVFPSLNVRERYSEKLWQFVSQALQNPDSPLFSIIINEKDIADMLISKEKVDAAICNGLKNYTVNYVSDRITNTNKSDILRKIKYLTLLSYKDDAAPYAVKISNLYANNNIDAIAGLLNVAVIQNMNENQRTYVERLIFNVKGMPRNKIIDYLLAKDEYYKKMIRLNLDKIDKYSN